MFATVVVVCPAGSSVSASMPTAMRSCLGTACAPAGALRRENTTATNATIAPRRAQILSTPTPPSQELADFQYVRIHRTLRHALLLPSANTNVQRSHLSGVVWLH